MAIAISNPSIRINDETISIVPNSVMVTLGGGEVNSRAASAGGNAIEIVHSSNAETKVGKINFDVYPTPDAISKITTWQRSIGANTAQVVGNLSDGSQFSLTMDTASLINDPELELSADGVISLEFSGAPVAFG